MALEVTTPYAHDELVDLYTFQSADVMYCLHPSYPVYKLTRTTLSQFVFTQVHFNPPATQPDEPLGSEFGSGLLTPGATTGTNITFTTQNATFLAGDLGRLIVSGPGRALITAVNSSTSVTVDIVDDFISTAPIAEADWRFVGGGNAELDPSWRRWSNNVTVDSNLALFRSTDVGKYITIYGGLIKITQFVSSTRVKGIILGDLKDATAKNPDPTDFWTIEVAAWSDYFGWPTAGCFFQGRMYLTRGQTIYGSVVGDFENFAKGSDDADAIVSTIDDDTVNPIVWIKGMQTLQAATGNGAYDIKASADKALTPNDFNIKSVSSRGSAKIKPIRVGGVLIYVQFGQAKMRELVYDFVTDKYRSPSLFLLAEHLTAPGAVVEIAYEQEPNSIIHAVRGDGVLLSLVYQEDEQVIGWSRHITDGLFKSITVIPRPTTGRDWLWAAIKRTINSVDETYIEYFEPTYQNPGRQWHDIQTDSAVMTTHDANFLITGLDHLEGETVRCIGDGMLFDDAVVASGQITLSPQRAVTMVEVGLNYESNATTLEPRIPEDWGGPFIARGWIDLGIRIRRTLGITLNGETLVYRKPFHPMDEQVPLQRGKKCIINLGYDPFGRIEVKQLLPFPAEVLNIVGKLHIGDRWDCDTVGDDDDVFF